MFSAARIIFTSAGVEGDLLEVLLDVNTSGSLLVLVLLGTSQRQINSQSKL